MPGPSVLGDVNTIAAYAQDTGNESELTEAGPSSFVKETVAPGDAAADARAILSQGRAVLGDVNTIAAYAQDMSEFLNESELTERRAFIETFVKETVVTPGDALLRYHPHFSIDTINLATPGRSI